MKKISEKLCWLWLKIESRDEFGHIPLHHSNNMIIEQEGVPPIIIRALQEWEYQYPYRFDPLTFIGSAITNRDLAYDIAKGNLAKTLPRMICGHRYYILAKGEVDEIMFRVYLVAIIKGEEKGFL